MFFGRKLSSKFKLFLACVLTCAVPGLGNTQTVMVHQGEQWTPQLRQAFYEQDQGSRIMPIAWMRALKGPERSSFLADALARYGYLPNPGGPEPDLPIGFTQTGGMVGMTCAACHTRQIKVGGTAYRIDGGPAIVDFQAFLADLESAVEEVLATEEGFDSFADAVLGPDAAEPAARALEQEVELWHLRFSTLIEESLPDPGWGPSRLDAISMIFNRLTGLNLGEPPDYIIRNNMRRADVPTRYPFLWNAPRQDQTQWLGFAANGNAYLALSRNLGQVYGVFGEFHPVPRPGIIANRDFLSSNSANFPGLRRVEELVEEMGPPSWPWELDHRLVEKGRIVFQRDPSDGGCVKCHGERPGKNRSLFSQTWATPIMDVGTDARACQLLLHEAEPGTLAGTKIRIPSIGMEIGQQPTRAIKLLEAVVIGAIAQDVIGTPFRPEPDLAMTELETSGQNDAEAVILPPEFEFLREAFPSTEDLPAAVVAVESDGSGCAYESRVLDGIWAAAPYLHNGSIGSLADLLKPVGERAASFKVGPNYDIEAVGLAVEQSRFDYTLETTDCSDVTSGNSRCGHEYGTGLSEEDRRALLEYLKSL